MKNSLISIIFRWIVGSLYLTSIVGAVYFVVYNPVQSRTTLAIVCYIGIVLGLIAMIIYARHGIAKSFRADVHSPTSRSKTLRMLIAFLAGSTIIDGISEYIGGQKGFTIGLILAVPLILGILYFYRKLNTQ